MQHLQDTNQYVHNEMEALEREQTQIDRQAGELEAKLRKIMGKCEAPPLPTPAEFLYLWLKAEHFTNPTPFLFTWVYKLENHAACYSSENKTNDEYIWLFW